MEWNERTENKLDSIVSDVNLIKVTLAAQNMSLEDHIKRTNILEGEIRPIKRHVYQVEGALKLLGALALMAAIVEAIAMVIKR